MQIEIASMLDPSPSSLFLFLLLPLWPTHNTSIVAQKKNAAAEAAAAPSAS